MALIVKGREVKYYTTFDSFSSNTAFFTPYDDGIPGFGTERTTNQLARVWIKSINDIAEGTGESQRVGRTVQNLLLKYSLSFTAGDTASEITAENTFRVIIFIDEFGVTDIDAANSEQMFTDTLNYMRALLDVSELASSVNSSLHAIHASYNPKNSSRFTILSDKAYTVSPGDSASGSTLMSSHFIPLQFRTSYDGNTVASNNLRIMVLPYKNPNAHGSTAQNWLFYVKFQLLYIDQ